MWQCRELQRLGTPYPEMQTEWFRVWLLLLFSHPVLSNSSHPHGLQHARPPRPSPSPGVCPSSCPFRRWCLWCPLLLLPSIFLSTRNLSNELRVHIRWPKYWKFRISPSSEYAGLISLKIDWFDLAVQRTSMSLLQHHTLKASSVSLTHLLAYKHV